MTLLLLAALLQAPVEEPRASLRGRFLVADTGEPISGVTVEISTQLHGQPVDRSTRSDADGGFTFERLPAGAWSLWARKTGYLPAVGFPITVPLEARQSRSDLVFRFHRHGIITGAVTDPEGSPAIGAAVFVYRYSWVEGRRSLRRVATAWTDDRGIYRLFGLPAGSYLVGAMAPSGENLDGEVREQPITFYPSGTHHAEAGRIQLRWGQELGDVNLTLRSQPGYSISGVVTDVQTGGPCRSCMLRVGRVEEGGVGFLLRYGLRADGSYRASGLVPGTYRVVVEKAAPPDGHTVSARTVTISNRSQPGVHLVAGVDRTLTGRVVLESPPDTLDRNELKLGVALQELTSLRARVDDRLAFEIRGVGPLPYQFRLTGLPEGGYFKTLRLGGRDLPAPEIEIPEEGTPGPLEALIAFDAATLSGTVQPPESAGRGHRVTHATVALFPEENQSAYLVVRRQATDATGAFTLTGIAPGVYTAFALPGGSVLEWDDPEVRRQFARYGRSVDLGRGKKVTVELTLAPESDGSQ